MPKTYLAVPKYIKIVVHDFLINTRKTKSNTDIWYSACGAQEEVIINLTYGMDLVGFKYLPENNVLTFFRFQLF